MKLRKYKKYDKFKYEWKNLYINGSSFHSIGKKYKVATSTVASYIRTLIKIEPRKPPLEITDKTLNDVSKIIDEKLISPVS